MRSTRTLLPLYGSLLVWLPLVGCGGDVPAPPVETTALPPSDPPPGSPAADGESGLAEPTELGQEVTTASGLSYETLHPGDGPQAKHEDRVVIHYTAMIEGQDEPFDSTREQNTPWTYTIGDSRAVQGFNEGVTGMKVGEVRRLVVPSYLAFGALGTFGDSAPGQARNLDGALQAEEVPAIPPNSTIVYDVELLEILEDETETESGEASESEPTDTEGDSPEG